MTDALVLALIAFAATVVEEVVSIRRQDAVASGDRLERANWCAGFAVATLLTAVAVVVNPVLGGIAYISGAWIGGLVAK